MITLKKLKKEKKLSILFAAGKNSSKEGNATTWA